LSTAPLERWLMNQVILESVDGIKIVDVSQSRKADHRFQADTVAALHLIRSVDPRRFRRIQREIEFIVNCEAVSFASYNRPLRRCEVDYGRLDATDDPEWYLWGYSAVVVHEATHGVLYSRHIAYTPELRSRIERLCHTEEKRFARRFDTAGTRWSDALVGDFDEQEWHPSWYSTFSQRWSRLITRIREARRDRTGRSS
jgi:hypothetical protein